MDNKVEIDTGLVPQCFNKTRNLKCKDRRKIRIERGEFKGKYVFLCLYGCTKEEANCPHSN